MINMTESVLELLKNNKCYCLKKGQIIGLSECNFATCHREKGCRKSTNNKVDKEIKERRRKNR